jgi:ligand-binding sensor domain-containing protein
MGVFYSPVWTKTQQLRVSPDFTPRLLIQAESGSFEATDQNRRQYISINGSNVVNSDSPRSYLISQLRNTNGAWALIASNGYDVYGSTTEAANAQSFLQSFLVGDLLVLNTWDEPYNNSVTYLNSELTNNFRSSISSFTRDFRDMHLLIAIKGKGVIYEEHRRRYSNSIHFSGWLN